MKQQELKVLELKSLQTTQNTNKKKPKLMIPHNMIPIARYRWFFDILWNQLELENEQALL